MDRVDIKSDPSSQYTQHYMARSQGDPQDCQSAGDTEPGAYQVEMTEENLGGLPEGTKVSMDNGYFSGPNLRFLEKNGLDGYIPDSKQAQEQKGLLNAFR